MGGGGKRGRSKKGGSRGGGRRRSKIGGGKGGGRRRSKKGGGKGGGRKRGRSKKMGIRPVNREAGRREKRRGGIKREVGRRMDT